MSDPTTDDPLNAEKKVTQLRQFRHRATETGRDLGKVVLDSYEITVTSFVQFERRAADATAMSDQGRCRRPCLVR
jgi:hypothetical protein